MIVLKLAAVVVGVGAMLVSIFAELWRGRRYRRRHLPIVVRENQRLLGVGLQPRSVKQFTRVFASQN
jgi:hypothetical protein